MTLLARYGDNLQGTLSCNLVLLRCVGFDPAGGLRLSNLGNDHRRRGIPLLTTGLEDLRLIPGER